MISSRSSEEINEEKCQILHFLRIFLQIKQTNMNTFFLIGLFVYYFLLCAFVLFSKPTATGGGGGGGGSS